MYSIRKPKQIWTARESLVRDRGMAALVLNLCLAICRPLLLLLQDFDHCLDLAQVKASGTCTWKVWITLCIFLVVHVIVLLHAGIVLSSNASTSRKKTTYVAILESCRFKSQKLSKSKTTKTHLNSKPRNNPAGNLITNPLQSCILAGAGAESKWSKTGSLIAMSCMEAKEICRVKHTNTNPGSQKKSKDSTAKCPIGK